MIGWLKTLRCKGIVELSNIVKLELSHDQNKLGRFR